MSHTAVTFEELLADFDATAANWKAFFAANPGAAEVPTDIAKSANIAALVWHIYRVALRHSERLLGEPVSALEAAPSEKTLEPAWEMQSRASANLRRFLESTDDDALSERMQFQTQTAGEVSGSRRKLCLHLFVHTIRHLAQIASIVRQHGFPPNWPQDIFFSRAIS